MADEEEIQEVLPDKSGVQRLSQALMEFLQKPENKRHLLPKHGVKKQESGTNITKQINTLTDGFLILDQMLPYLLSADEWEDTDKEFETAIMNLNVTNFSTDDSPLTLHKITELSDMTLFHFYQVARLLYSRNQFGQAANVFRILVVLDPLVSDFWIAYGLSLQNDHQHLDALHAYAAAILLSDSPAPHIYSAECYLVIDHPEDARMELEEARALVDQQNIHNQWDSLIKRISDRLKQPAQ